MNINSKIKEIRTSLKLSQEEFADKIGTTRSNLSQMEIGKSTPTYDTLMKIVNIFHINPSTFFLDSKTSYVEESGVEYKSKKYIPLIPIEAIAGNGNGGVAIMQEDIQERYVIPDFEQADFMIHVKGSSMYPKYNSGDIVACKFIKERSFFQWGRVYVLHHKEQGTMIKRLFPTDNAKILECKSDNPNYPPFNLDLKSIDNIALVIGVVRLE